MHAALLYTISKAMQGQTWLDLGWKFAKEAQGCYAEAGNGKPPLAVNYTVKIVSLLSLHFTYIC